MPATWPRTHRLHALLWFTKLIMSWFARTYPRNRCAAVKRSSEVYQIDGSMLYVTGVDSVPQGYRGNSPRNLNMDKWSGNCRHSRSQSMTQAWYFIMMYPFFRLSNSALRCFFIEWFPTQPAFFSFSDHSCSFHLMIYIVPAKTDGRRQLHSWGSRL